MKINACLSRNSDQWETPKNIGGNQYLWIKRDEIDEVLHFYLIY